MTHNGHAHSPEDAEAIRRYRAEKDEDEILDPDAYREASRRMARVLNAAVLFVLHAQNPRLAAWQVAYTLGLPLCEGVPMTARATTLGVCKAAFSKGAKAFQRAAQLPPSAHMKDSDSTGAYSDARNSQLDSQ